MKVEGGRRWAHVTVALLGAPLTAFVLVVVLTTLMPGSPDVRLLTAMLSVFPVMAAAACLAWWSRSSGRAWVICFALIAFSLLVHRLK
ncbi:hypothetical protein [Chondromyces crocatus]|uniref:Uncharacterized protein n=1 Tax=Chondromyces crocatus TaxID=52 RepID=A0A0K1EBF7_CHOCO|nr:hypothetical protein [Chondromyces crocatus]AKT38195.1 uncharacterized protein CMC5_023380 [Chondromyces crocatus]